jgi:hypothetical protein
MGFRHVIPYSKWHKVNEVNIAAYNQPSIPLKQPILTNKDGSSIPNPEDKKEGAPVVKTEDPAPSGIPTPNNTSLRDDLITIAVNKTVVKFIDLMNENKKYFPAELYKGKKEFWEFFTNVQNGTLSKPEFAKMVKDKKLIFCPPVDSDMKVSMDYFTWFPSDDTGENWTLEPYTQPGFNKIAWTFKDSYSCPVPTTKEEREKEPTLGETFPQLGLGNPDSSTKTCPFGPGEWLYVKQFSGSEAPEYNGQKKVSARSLAATSSATSSTLTTSATPAVPVPTDILILEQDYETKVTTGKSYGYVLLIKRNQAQGGSASYGGVRGGSYGVGGYGTPVEKYSAKYF